MADVCVSLTDNQSFTLIDIASGLSGETSAEKKYNRLKFFLDSIDIDTNFWKSFVHAIFSLPSLNEPSVFVVSRW